jgi:hypothetical protein
MTVAFEEEIQSRELTDTTRITTGNEFGVAESRFLSMC